MKQDIFEILKDNTEFTSQLGLTLDSKRKKIFVDNYELEVKNSKYFDKTDGKSFFFNLERVSTDFDEDGNPEGFHDMLQTLSFTPTHMYGYNKKFKAKIAKIYNDKYKLSYGTAFSYTDYEQLEKLLKVIVPEILNVLKKLINERLERELTGEEEKYV
jgi:hypothetical protein